MTTIGYKLKYEEKLLPWEVELKESLISRCHSFIKANTQPPPIIEKPKLWSHFVNHDHFEEHHNYELVNYGHGHYSEYVSVKSNQYQSNEFVQYFHFIKHLFDTHSADYEINLFEISNKVEVSKDCKEWMKICQKYLIDLTIQEMFFYYHLLLVKGVACLNNILTKKKAKCSKAALLYKIMEIKRFQHEGNRINSHIPLSMDKGDEVSLENMSKTFKYLYCSICMVYDCQRHFLPTNAQENNFQYVQHYDVRHRIEKQKTSAQRLFQQILSFTNESLRLAQQPCSDNCFRKLNEESGNKLKLMRRKKIFSPIFKGLVKMGVELYYYNPCSIRSLFLNFFAHDSSRNIQQAFTCEEIFFYFIHEFNLINKLEYKFYETEVDQLMNEAKEIAFFSTAPKKQMKKIEKASKKKEGDDEYNSICFHYFLDKQPTDVTCLSCDCQTRGYCLPSCGCSDLCEIRRVGCRCKNESTCWQNKCPCFKGNLMCLPSVCEHCIKDEEKPGKTNWCQNNERLMHRNKLTRIGKSNIENAGLGLFAGEAIFKGQFVIKYVGEVVDSVSLEKIRESLVENNLFYTFKLNKFESVDSRVFGNKARFINHSKRSANLIPRSVRINEEDVIVFHASRDIQPGEELYFNYNGEGELSEFREKYPFID